MRPTRAAWFFIAGIAWLVLRGILGRSVSAMHPLAIADSGGVWLLVPALSVAASATIPLFYIAFLRHHDFAGQPWLLAATRAAGVASILSASLVLVSYVGLLGGPGSPAARVSEAAPWLFQVVPLLLMLSLVAFHVAFAGQCRCASTLRRSAAVAAAGALIPTLLMVVWLVHAMVPSAVPWWPGVASSNVARGLGLAGAAALVWFLESFAVAYDGGRGPVAAGGA